MFTVDGVRPATVDRIVSGSNAKDAWDQLCKTVFKSSMYGDITSVHLLNP